MMYFTLDNAAKAMQCSAKTIKRMIDAGELQFIEVGVGSRKSLRVKLPEPKTKDNSNRGRLKKYVGSILDRPNSNTTREQTR